MVIKKISDFQNDNLDDIVESKHFVYDNEK